MKTLILILFSLQILASDTLTVGLCHYAYSLEYDIKLKNKDTVFIQYYDSLENKWFTDTYLTKKGKEVVSYNLPYHSKYIRLSYNFSFDSNYSNNGHYIRFKDFSLLCQNKPLPITLTSLEAIKRGNNINIKWRTEQEFNNDYFIIMISYDLVHWGELATVDGAGNSSWMLDYEYEYKDVNYSGHIYFRLVQVDFNSTRTISDIISVKISNQLEGQAYNLLGQQINSNYSIKLR